MTARKRITLASLFGIFALTLSAGALSDDRWDDRGRGWGHEKHYYKHHRHHHHGARHVIIREAPVVYERRVYYERPYYEGGYYRSYYAEPTLSFGFTVPLR